MLKKIRKILILSLLGTILLYAKEDNSSNINTEINEIIKKSEIERKKEEKEEKRREKEAEKIRKAEEKELLIEWLRSQPRSSSRFFFVIFVVNRI